MRTLFLLITLLVSNHAFAQVDPEMKRIFNDINFIAYQLSLDFNPQEMEPRLIPSKERKTPSHKKAPTPLPTPSIAVNPISRQFSGSTVWADLSVKILDYGTRMVLQVKSSSPAMGWMLQKGSSSNILFKGNVEANALNFQINVPRQYSPDLGLTVIVNNADGQNPAYLALK